MKKNEIKVAFEMLIELIQEDIKLLNEYMQINIKNKNYLIVKDIK